MSTMTLEQVRDAIRARPYVEDSIMLAWADAIDAHRAQPAQAVDTGRWYVCVSCRLMVNLPKETPRLAQCQCSPGGWSLLPAKLPKGYQLIRALTGEKAGPVDGWQPIETAPQDGTRVLLWVDQTCRVGSWKYFPADAQNPCAPTHWMPLPASPAPDKEGSSTTHGEDHGS